MRMTFADDGRNIAVCDRCGYKTRPHAVPDNAWKQGKGHTCESTN